MRGGTDDEEAAVERGEGVGVGRRGVCGGGARVEGCVGAVGGRPVGWVVGFVGWVTGAGWTSGEDTFALLMISAGGVAVAVLEVLVWGNIQF